MAASAVMQSIGGPDEAVSGAEFSIRCQAQNTGNVGCYLHIILYDADTDEVLYDYGRFGLINPGSTLNPFPGTWPTEKLVTMPDYDWNLIAKVWVDDRVEPDDELTKTIYIPVLRFADVAISRRYGDRLYFSGKLKNIVYTDELCVLYSRPGSVELLNVGGDSSWYTYIRNAVGSFIFENHNKYLEFTNPGYYILEAWDVIDDCETRSQKRASCIIDVTQTKYQYQLYFDVDAPELGGKGYLLQAEWDKYNSWKPYNFTFEEPDCFPIINGTQQTTPQQIGSGWLCQAAEFLKSGCWPLPWWMCRSLTDWDVYMRGECSCDHFQNTLKELGIPCHHLIAMYKEYGAKPPYCEYIKCP